jgi:ribonuclease III
MHPLEATLGHTFADAALLERALTHRSVAPQHNERLEFVGDRVLNVLVAQALYDAYPAAPEGELSVRHAALVRTEALGTMAEKWGLAAHLRTAGGAHGIGSNMLADAVEALLGAVFLDAGLPAAAGVVQRWWGPLVAAQGTHNWQDPKTVVQEMLQAQKLPLPVYKIISETGPDHAKHFVVEITTALGRATGTGASKHKAGVVAAQALLSQINESPVA